MSVPIPRRAALWMAGAVAASVWGCKKSGTEPHVSEGWPGKASDLVLLTD